MKKKLLLGLAVFFLAAACSHARTVRITGADVTLPEIGSAAPEFKLFGTDLRYHSLDMYREADAIALVFTCNHCPVSVAYEDDLVNIANEYQEKNIRFIAINTNPADKVARDGFMEMIQRADEKNFPFPYLYDETQKVSEAYGARRTPHIYVLDGERKIAYTGAVDRRHGAPYYLKDALDALLADEEIEVKETEARGCTVKYRTRDERIERFGYDVFEN